MTEPTTRPKSRTLRILVAELVGTMILIVGGPGTAILATGNFFESGSVGVLGVALAFGLALLCAAYAIGSVSGCHINPAVTLGLWAIKKTDGKDVPYYIGGQVVGGLLGASSSTSSPAASTASAPRPRASRRTATAPTRPAASRSAPRSSWRSSSPLCSSS